MTLLLSNNDFSDIIGKWPRACDKCVCPKPVVCIIDIVVPHLKKETYEDADMEDKIASVSRLFGLKKTVAILMSENAYLDMFPKMDNQVVSVSITSVRHGCLVLFLETKDKTGDDQFLSYLNLYDNYYADSTRQNVDEYDLRISCDLMGIATRKFRTVNRTGSYSL